MFEVAPRLQSISRANDMERPAIDVLLRRWLNEGIQAGNVGVFDELLQPDVCDTSTGQVSYGTETFKRRASAVHQAFSNIEAQVEQLLVDGERIAWRWSVTGTHTGSFAGFAASGRRVTLRGVNFQRLEAGRVAEHWTLADSSDLTRR
jgi:steroid delta-isomerase-like uncharacterized protein